MGVDGRCCGVASFSSWPHTPLLPRDAGNSAVALSLPLTLDRIVPAWAAIIVSVTGILVFGEVLPQAICSRHALAIGAFFAKPVRLLMYVFLPISWPLAKLLDNMLGTSDGDFLRRDEMATFIGLHESGALDSKGSNEEPLVTSEVRVLKGALGLSGKCAMDVATPIDHVFSLKTDTVLNRQQVEEIIDRGFSRVPLHKGDDPTMLTSYLLVKSLALVDPAARVPLNAASGARTRDLPRAPSDMPLYDLMALFQSQHAHMAGLYAPGDTSGAVVAVVTLEDLLEELVGTEIVDETDIFVDVVKSIRVVNAFRRGRKGGNGGAIGSAARNRLHSDDSAGSAQVAQTMLDQAAAAEGATGGTQVSIV